jgi:hypothetical protein
MHANILLPNSERIITTFDRNVLFLPRNWCHSLAFGELKLSLAIAYGELNVVLSLLSYDYIVARGTGGRTKYRQSFQDQVISSPPAGRH